MSRIAITAMGGVSALGTGVAAFDDGLRRGRCGIGELSLFSAEGYRTSLAAEVRELELPAFLRDGFAKRASRTTLLCLVAAAEAWAAAGLAGEADDVGVVLGTTTGGMAVGEECFRLELAGERNLHALSSWLETPVSVPADAVARAFGLLGPRLTVSTACSSSANALGIAADWIRRGRAAAVLCGGADALCRMTYSGFNSLQALDRGPCRPFDRNRAGLTLGEAAAFFLFEDWDRARARGADIVAEFVSYGTSADAHHITQPRPDGAGAILATRRALEEGGIAADEIDYVNAHGTGTPQNDSAESRALKEILGERAYRVPVSSTKSMIGHCLGAAGAIEALASVLALRGGYVPPTVNLVEPDPECDLDYVPGASRPASLGTILSNSYGFGGNNTSVILRAAGAGA